MFDPTTRDKLLDIHQSAANHAGILADSVHAAQAQGQEPSTTITRAFVRNAATAQISAAMLMCIDNGVDLTDIRTMLSLDAIVEAEKPQEMLDHLSAISHLDFEVPDDTDD